MPKETRSVIDRENSEAVVKKRRMAKPPVNVELLIKSNETDAYSSLVEYEEKESIGRNANDDANIYFKTCDDLRELFNEISQLKLSESNKEIIREKRVMASLKILILKKLNRLEKYRMKQYRDALQKAREQVDRDHLMLQNLLYEAMHLNKEVKKCMDFRSKDEQLDLIPVEEFYSTAPKEISKPEVTVNNPHELKLARLQWELIQRKSLSEECKKLELENEVTNKEINNKRDQLNQLLPALEAVIDASKPVQEYLNIPFQKVEKLHSRANQLPKPLYALFVQVDAFSKIKKWVTVNIIGEMNCKPEVLEPTLDDISSAESNSDEELNDSNHRRKISHQDRRSKTKTKALAEKLEQRKRDCLKIHPMSIVVKITVPSGEILSIEFQWLVQLEIICVVATLNGFSSSSSSNLSISEVLSARHLLICLEPGDTGNDFPNPATSYLLARAGLGTVLPSSNSIIGIPYKWAQELAGLVFLSPVQTDISCIQRNMERTLKMLRRRAIDRIQLARETITMEKEQIHVKLKSKSRKFLLFPITFNDFQSLPGYKAFENKTVIDLSFFFFKTSLTYAPAKVIIHVAMPPNYPNLPPIFLVEVHHNGVHNAINNEGIRDIEREANLVFGKTFKEHGLFTNQIMKLTLHMEVFLHTEFPQDFDFNFVLFRPVQGRDRSHPLKFHETAGGIFTH